MAFTRPNGSTRFAQLSAAKQPLPSAELDGEYNQVASWINANATWTQNLSEWSKYQATPIFVSSTQFTVSGDATSEFQVDRRVRANLNGTYAYSTVSVSSYVSPNTTVTLRGAVLTASLTEAYYGFLAVTNQSYPDILVPRVIAPVGGDGSYMKVPSLTTAQRDALTPAAGMVIYNSTTAQLERYQTAAWGAFTSPDATITSSDHAIGASASDGEDLVTWLGAADLKLEINGTAVRVAATASAPQRAPVIGGKGRVVADATTATTTLSGVAGARYIMADVSATATTFTLTNDTDNTPTSTEKLVGVAYWDGAAITHVATRGRTNTYKKTTATTHSTAAASFVDVTDHTVTIATDGFSCVCITAQIEKTDTTTAGTSDAEMVWVLDGTIVGQGEDRKAGNQRTSTCLTYLSDILAAGSHTFKLQHRVNGGSGSSIVSPSTYPSAIFVVWHPIS